MSSTDNIQEPPILAASGGRAAPDDPGAVVSPSTEVADEYSTQELDGPALWREHRALSAPGTAAGPGWDWRLPALAVLVIAGFGAGLHLGRQMEHRRQRAQVPTPVSITQGPVTPAELPGPPAPAKTEQPAARVKPEITAEVRSSSDGAGAPDAPPAPRVRVRTRSPYRPAQPPVESARRTTRPRRLRVARRPRRKPLLASTRSQPVIRRQSKTHRRTSSYQRYSSQVIQRVEEAYTIWQRSRRTDR